MNCATAAELQRRRIVQWRQQRWRTV